MNRRWSLAAAETLRTAALSADLQLSRLLAQCLINRGLNDPDQIGRFLDPRLKQLSDPFLLPNMRRAVERLFAARDRGERLVIFGDYDVDGVTSTVLLTETLRALGWTCEFYLPNRLEEGYGLSQEAVENCVEKSTPTLLLAVDCGSTALRTIDWLRAQGVDTIVLDHHQVSSPAPQAVALVNPQLSEGGRSTELCSAGLAFKLAHALAKHGRQLGLAAAAEIDLRRWLDLVALGTVADMVPLVEENRIFVTAGIERLNHTQRPGLQALRAVAGINGRIGVYEIAFQLAPRLNAAGRLENALNAFDLLTAGALPEAEVLARALDAQNRERQRIERGIAEQVTGVVRSKFNPETDYVIVEGQLYWHVGVVGIVASRVLREFYRPTIIMGGEGDEWRGSGRSIDGFDLAAALGSCSDLLTRHGGHAMAAGLSLPAGNVEALRLRLNEIARQLLPPAALQPLLRIDAECVLNELTFNSLSELARLEPIGQGNAPVQLLARRLSNHRLPQRLGKDQQHVKLWVTDGTARHEAIWWNCGRDEVPQGTFDLVFEPQFNEYNGRQLVQLKVLDWKASA